MFISKRSHGVGYTLFYVCYINLKAICDGYYYYLHFIKEETETQKDELNTSVTSLVFCILIQMYIFWLIVHAFKEYVSGSQH